MKRRISDRALPLLRLYMGGNAIVAWHNATTNPSALLYRVAFGSSDGQTLVWFMGFFGLALIADLFINDILPEKYHWKGALKYRHFLLLALAFCYIAQLFVGSMGGQVLHLLIYNLWNAGMIMMAAFLDAKSRSRNSLCVVTCS